MNQEQRWMQMKKSKKKLKSREGKYGESNRYQRGGVNEKDREGVANYLWGSKVRVGEVIEKVRKDGRVIRQSEWKGKNERKKGNERRFSE